MIEFILKKIFLVKERKTEKVRIVSSEYHFVNDKPITFIKFLVKASGKENLYNGEILLDGYINGNYMEKIKKFIGKKVRIEVSNSREKNFMNKRIVNRIIYRGKVYELSNSI